MSFSAWNGLGLALVIPCVQSLIADVYSSATRGRAFGLLFLTSGLGAHLLACRPCP
jgi:MFS family permease